MGGIWGWLLMPSLSPVLPCHGAGCSVGLEKGRSGSFPLIGDIFKHRLLILEAFPLDAEATPALHPCESVKS